MSKTCYDFTGTIVDIRLPSIDDFEGTEGSEARDVFHYHIWLSDMGISPNKRVAIINGKGEINYDGVVPNKKTIGVQPVVVLGTDDFYLGDQIDIAGVTWTVIEKAPKTITALCEDVIAYRRFDPKVNIWMVSEIRDWLDEWLSYLVEGNEEINYISFADDLPF